jgi:hypothetical protein
MSSDDDILPMMGQAVGSCGQFTFCVLSLSALGIMCAAQWWVVYYTEWIAIADLTDAGLDASHIRHPGHAPHFTTSP